MSERTKENINYWIGTALIVLGIAMTIVGVSLALWK